MEITYDKIYSSHHLSLNQIIIKTMTNFSFNDALSQAEKEFSNLGSSKGDFFKLKEGKNRVRILTPLVPYASHFVSKTEAPNACVGKEDCPDCKKIVKDKDGNDKENTPSVKFVCHVLNTVNGKVELAQFAPTIFYSLRDLQNDPEWSFNELPMPYDITINAEGAGTTSVKYSVVASPTRSALAPEITAKLTKIHSPEQFKSAMIEKRKKALGLVTKDIAGAVEYPENENDPTGVGTVDF
jgi:hypothetical protein